MLADGAAEQTLHGKAGLALAGGLPFSVKCWGGVVETADGKQVDDLLVEFFLAVDETAHHLLGIAVHRGQFQVEINGR